MKTKIRYQPVLVASWLVLTMAFMSGCQDSFGGVRGTGEIKTETREFPPFDEIDFGGKGQIALITGDKYEVRVEAYENLLPLLQTEVRDGRLKLKFKKRVRSKKPIRFYITAPVYKALDMSGSIEIKSAGVLVTDELDLEFSGASEGILEVKTKELRTTLSGASEMKFSGTTDFHKISISGAGEIKALDLKSKNIELRISGAGDAKVYATEELKVRISGAGDVRYKGDPNIEKKVSGAGSIKPY